MKSKAIRILFLSAVWAWVAGGCQSTQLESLDNQTAVGGLPEEEQKIWSVADRVEQEVKKHSADFAGKAEVERYLNEVMRRVTGEFSNPNIRVRVTVVANPSPNAYILPNGASYVNTGILALLENEAQLACVLSHEFVHFKYRHGYRQRIHAKNQEVSGAVIGILAAGILGTGGAGEDSVTGLWAMASSSGFSKDLERQADRLGMMSMVRAGYDSKEAAKAFRRLRWFETTYEAEEKGWFASHPKTEDRIASYREYEGDPEILAAGGEHKVNAEDYNRISYSAILENARVCIDFQLYEIAENNLGRCAALRPNDAGANYLLGRLEHERAPTDAKGAEQAMGYFQKAIAADPQMAKSYREVGLLYRFLDERVKSQEYFEKYLELDPNAADGPIIRSYIQESKESVR